MQDNKYIRERESKKKKKSNNVHKWLERKQIFIVPNFQIANDDVVFALICIWFLLSRYFLTFRMNQI